MFGLSLRYLTGSNECALSPGFTCQTSTLTRGSNNWLYVRQLLVDKKSKKYWTEQRELLPNYTVGYYGYTPQQEPKRRARCLLEKVKAVG